MNLSLAKQQLEENGYSILESIYTKMKLIILVLLLKIILIIL